MTPVLRHRNTTLYIDHSHLLDAVTTETYLTADAASGAGTITVRNITGFAINQILLIGEFGNEGAEIMTTHASTTPSGTTITFAATTTTARAHYVGEKVRVLLYNRFELSNATTATGSKTVLTVANGNPPSSLGTGLIAIDPSRKIQTYEDVEYTTGFYFARYRDSIDAVYGGYSDALAYGGFADNTVGHLIEVALQRIGKTLSEKLTRRWFYNEINDCFRLIKGKQLRWPEHYVHDYVLGQTSRGVFRFTLPSDIYSNDTNKSITAVRIGTGKAIQYLDPLTYENQKLEVVHTEVRTAASAGATTLEIDNSYDFADSGTVNVYVSGTKYSITYTGVTRSATAGVLTGVPASGTGSITVTIAVDTNVWQDEREGQPIYYTVRDGSLDIWPLPDANYDNANVFLDYDTVATAVNSDGDEVDFQRFDMVLDYVTWKAKGFIRNDGEMNFQDYHYLSFKERLNDAIRTLHSGKKFPWRPNINTVNVWGSSKRFVSPADRSGSN